MVTTVPSKHGVELRNAARHTDSGLLMSGPRTAGQRRSDTESQCQLGFHEASPADQVGRDSAAGWLRANNARGDHVHITRTKIQLRLPPRRPAFLTYSAIGLW